MTIYRSVGYLQKQRYVPRQILSPPAKGLALIIIIPCFAELTLLRTLASLEAADPIEEPIEVLIVLNQGTHHGSDIQSINLQTKQEFDTWNHQRRLTYHILDMRELPKKHAGVGLARKIGMDEAIDRFEQAGTEDGVIVNLDADSQVSSGYLRMISGLTHDSSAQAWSLRFEHPIDGNEFSPSVYQGIVLYELFLRYYIQGLRWAAYPMAFHTIGSSMAVRASAYQAQGGMNRRKAGEDFYFLHKFSALGKLKEAHSAWIIPSPRRSDKVPFGTGKAIGDYLDRGDGTWNTYPPSVFNLLRELVDLVPSFYHGWPSLSPIVEAFLMQEGLPAHLLEMRKHSKTQRTFQRRFYTWLDPLKVLKLIHFLRDQHTGDIPLMEAAGKLLAFLKHPAGESSREMLQIYRTIQTPA